MKHCTQLCTAFSSTADVEMMMEGVISTAYKLINNLFASILKGPHFLLKQKGLGRKGKYDFHHLSLFCVKMDV